MKLYAPSYYKKFKCIADKCEHSCCIGWEIDIDSESLEKYRTLEGGYGDVIRSSISYDGEPHFILDSCERCPHLDGRGLCKIIINVGEGYLCDICREHPRFYNFTDVAEVGIGMSCPEGARVILSSPDYHLLDEIGQVSADTGGDYFDGRAERGRVYELLRGVGEDYGTRLENIYREYRIPVDDDSVWSEKIASLEYLNGEHRNLFMRYSSKRRPAGVDEYLERSLGYFIYRHCTEAFDAEDFRIRLRFCLFCERLLASLAVLRGAGSLDGIAALASIISEEIEYSDDNTLSLTY